MADIHQFNHRAMATFFEVRIADEERAYAAQAAQAALDLLDKLESRLSRFRAHSDVAQIAELAPGETMRLSEPAFACLQIAKKMELATFGAFSITAAALQTQSSLPQWALLPAELSIRCKSGAIAIRFGRHRQGVCTRSHGGAAAQLGLPVVSVGCWRQQHSGGRSAKGNCRLVLRPGR